MTVSPPKRSFGAELSGAAGLMDIRPVPTDEEAAAIAAAIEVSWPRAVVAGEVDTPPRWRFAGRWWTRPIPVRRDRPW